MGLFKTAGSDRTRWNGFKLKEGRSRLHMRKKLFYCEDGKSLEQAAQKAADASSLGVFKARLDKLWSNLV